MAIIIILHSTLLQRGDSLRTLARAPQWQRRLRLLRRGGAHVRWVGRVEKGRPWRRIAGADCHRPPAGGGGTLGPHGRRRRRRRAETVSVVALYSRRTLCCLVYGTTTAATADANGHDAI